MNKRPTFVTLLMHGCLLLALAVSAYAQANRFAVQIEAFPSRAEAEQKVSQLKAQGLAAYIVKSNVPGKGVFFRVRVGNFTARPAAERYGQQLKTQGAIADFYIAAYETPEPETPTVTAKPQPLPNQPPATTAVNKEPAKPQPKTTTLTPTTTTTTTAAAKPATPPNAMPASAPPSTPAATPAANTTSNAAPVMAAGYARYQDQNAGYSFEHPQYWVGGALNPNEMQSQNVSAGAMFKSNEDAAFLNAIWNRLDKANSPDHDNDMIVDAILKSMGSGNGTQNMQAISRRVVTEGEQIKTFLDLKAAFQVPNQPAPLDFIGKGIIIRASKGILLLVAFYSKDAPQTVAITADHIIQTARTPE